MKHLETNKKSKGRNTKTYIVLHHTASTAPAEDVAKYLAYNSAQASAHYVVGEAGEVYKIGEDDDILWHAGVSKWDGRTNLNKYSIGIEINSDGNFFTDAQRVAVKELIQELMLKHKIPHTNVIRHKDVAPRRKWDVGDQFWAKEFKSFKDYQESLKLPSMNNLESIILTLKDLWHEQSKSSNKRKISQIANQIREIQKSIGIEVTK